MLLTTATSTVVPRTPSVALIGSGPMPVQCGEILLKAGFSIIAIHSPDRPLKEWATSNGLGQSYYQDFDVFAALVQTEKIDFLFSIVNFTILPQPLISAPQCMAINYHDGPLPRYAGSHAAEWALYNKELHHGVTWHVMEARVDAGDILKQRLFAVTVDETIESLNRKCFVAAMRAFQELVVELKNGTFTRTQQDLSKRTFYRFSQCPPKAGAATQ